MRLRAPAWLALAALVGGCAGGGRVDEPLELDNISFYMEPGANGDAPARLALVRVEDERLVADLLKIEAGAWFAGEGRAFRNAHPKTIHDDWEVVPGRTSGPFDVEVDERVAGVLFCDTQDDAPPTRLEANGDLSVRVSASGCEVGPGQRRESVWQRLRRREFVNVTFTTSADANGSRPVRVELLRAPHAETADEVARLDARAWFGAAGREFRLGHPDTLFDYWELVPGSTHGPVRFAVNPQAGGVLFCEHRQGGALRFEWEDEMDIVIDREGCALAEEAAQAAGGRFAMNPLRWLRGRGESR